MVQVRDDRNDAGLDQDWGLGMKVYGQPGVGKLDGVRAKILV